MRLSHMFIRICLEETETEKSRAVERMRQVQKDVRPKSLLTPHQRRGKPISASAIKRWRISESKVTKRFNRNSSSFNIGSFRNQHEKSWSRRSQRMYIFAVIHLFIKLCSRWNVMGRERDRVENLCPIHSGYGHMNGPFTTIGSPEYLRLALYCTPMQKY